MIPNFPISRFPDFPISRFPDFPMFRFPDFPISRFPDFPNPQSPDFPIFRFPDFPEFLNFIGRVPDFQTPEFVPGLQRGCDSRGLPLHLSQLNLLEVQPGGVHW